MRARNSYDASDLDALLFEKAFFELDEHERAFVMEHVSSEQEYEDMRKTLLNIDASFASEELLTPSPKVKEELLSAFAEEGKKKGMVIWLNSAAPLFFPQNKSFIRQPGFQVAIAAMLVIGLFIVIPDLQRGAESETVAALNTSQERPNDATIQSSNPQDTVAFEGNLEPAIGTNTSTIRLAEEQEETSIAAAPGVTNEALRAQDGTAIAQLEDAEELKQYEADVVAEAKIAASTTEYTEAYREDKLNYGSGSAVASFEHLNGQQSLDSTADPYEQAIESVDDLADADLDMEVVEEESEAAPVATGGFTNAGAVNPATTSGTTVDESTIVAEEVALEEVKVQATQSRVANSNLMQLAEVSAESVNRKARRNSKNQAGRTSDAESTPATASPSTDQVQGVSLEQNAELIKSFFTAL